MGYINAFDNVQNVVLLNAFFMHLIEYICYRNVTKVLNFYKILYKWDNHAIMKTIMSSV